MTIKNHRGKFEIVCDICNREINTEIESIKPFTVKGIDRLFHLHKACKPILLKAHFHKNYNFLPDCTLKQAYFEALIEKKQSELNR